MHGMEWEMTPYHIYTYIHTTMDSRPRSHRIPPTPEGWPVPVGWTIVSALRKAVEVCKCVSVYRVCIHKPSLSFPYRSIEHKSTN
jgi:hypothetical protein